MQINASQMIPRWGIRIMEQGKWFQNSERPHLAKSIVNYIDKFL